MTEESCHRIVAGKRGGGYWYVLLNSSGVEEKKKKSLGTVFERRVTDRVGGIIWIV